MIIFTRIQEYFWTDSQVVLGYIKNNAKKFKIFSANERKAFIGSIHVVTRVGLIRVGKRLQKPNQIDCVVHPVILFNLGKSTMMMITCCHRKAAQSGMNISLNEIKGTHREKEPSN